MTEQIRDKYIKNLEDSIEKGKLTLPEVIEIYQHLHDIFERTNIVKEKPNTEYKNLVR